MAVVVMATNFELSKKQRDIGDSFSNVSLRGEERDEPRWKKRRVFIVATRRVFPSGDTFKAQIYAPQSTTLQFSSQSFLRINFPDLQPQTVSPPPSSPTVESITVMKSSNPMSKIRVT